MYKKRACLMLLKCLIPLPDTRWLLVHSMLWPLTAMTHDSLALSPIEL